MSVKPSGETTSDHWVTLGEVARREPLGRSGYVIELVRLRGSLQSLITWVTDTKPACGCTLLDGAISSVKAWSVPSERDGYRRELRDALGEARRGWPDQRAFARHQAVSRALGIVHHWLDDLGRSSP